MPRRSTAAPSISSSVDRSPPAVTLDSFVAALNRWINDGKPDAWTDQLDRVGDGINALVDPLGNTLLHLTTLRATVRGIEDLLAIGANPCAINAEGNTPLASTRGWRNRAGVQDCRDALTTGMRNWAIAREREALHQVLDDPEQALQDPASTSRARARPRL